MSVARVSGLIDRGGTRFLERWFTPDEIAYCNAKSQPTLHFAARLAAKEAVFKALHKPGDGAIPWRSIEIGHDRIGAPEVRLSGSLLEAATRDGIGGVSPISRLRQASWTWGSRSPWSGSSSNVGASASQ